MRCGVQGLERLSSCFLMFLAEAAKPARSGKDDQENSNFSAFPTWDPTLAEYLTQIRRRGDARTSESRYGTQYEIPHEIDVAVQEWDPTRLLKKIEVQVVILRS